MGRVYAAGVLALFASIASCAGQAIEAVPFETVPPDKSLNALTPAERAGACEWATAVGRTKLAPNGIPVTCHENAISLGSCTFPSSAQVGCTATVGEWKVCLPRFFAAIAADPCRMSSLASSEAKFDEFVDAITGCEGQAACAYFAEP